MKQGLESDYIYITISILCTISFIISFLCGIYADVILPKGIYHPDRTYRKFMKFFKVLFIVGFLLLLILKLYENKFS